MIFGDFSGQLRKWQEEARARRVADAPDRALRLYAEIVVRWTGVFREAADEIVPGGSPCDYEPWRKAIGEVGPRLGLEPDTFISSRALTFIACLGPLKLCHYLLTKGVMQNGTETIF